MSLLAEILVMLTPLLYLVAYLLGYHLGYELPDDWTARDLAKALCDWFRA